LYVSVLPIIERVGVKLKTARQEILNCCAFNILTVRNINFLRNRRGGSNNRLNNACTGMRACVRACVRGDGILERRNPPVLVTSNDLYPVT